MNTHDHDVNPSPLSPPSTYLLAIMDGMLRVPAVAKFILRSSHDRCLYNEIDIIYSIEYTTRIFNTMSQKFVMNAGQAQTMHLVSFVYFLKMMSDVILYKPFTFVWCVLHDTRICQLGTSRAEFIETCKFYEQLLVSSMNLSDVIGGF
jgi:hypothetical protein